MSGLGNGCPSISTAKTSGKCSGIAATFSSLMIKLSPVVIKPTCGCSFFFRTFSFLIRNSGWIQSKAVGLPFDRTCSQSCYIHIMIGQFVGKNDISNSHPWGQRHRRTRIDNGFHFKIIGQDCYTHSRHDFSGYHFQPKRPHGFQVILYSRLFQDAEAFPHFQGLQPRSSTPGAWLR